MPPYSTYISAPLIDLIALASEVVLTGQL
jgi:hypothetical protein